MFLDDILKRNEEYVRGRAARPLPPPETLHLVAVACYDPRLDPLLGPALGVDHGDAFLLRTAGAYVAPSGGIIRSLALAVYMFGAREVAVVGHTSCRMAAFKSADFIDAFRSRGVRREAFGSEDLRAWAGAIPDPKSGVQQSVASILAAPFLPKDLAVAGLVLDDATGGLQVVHRPGDPLPVIGVAASAPAPEAGTAFAAAPAPSHTASRPAPRASEPAPRLKAAGPEAREAAPEPEPEAAAAGDATEELLHSVHEIRTFVKALEESAAWRHELRKVRDAMAREQNPKARLALLETFVRRASGQWKEVAAAFDRLKRETASARRSLDRDQLVDLFRRSAG